MAKIPQWQRAIITVSTIITAVVVVGALYWAQAVIIPIAIAVFLAFLLNPLVRLLQYRGLPRLAAAVIVFVVASTLVAGLGWLVAKQANSLIAELPKYTVNVKNKIRAVREATAGTEKLNRMIKEVGGELNGEKNKEGEATTGPGSEPRLQKPTPVVVQAESPTWLAHMPILLGSAAKLGAELGLAMALVLFFLLATDDLRNRFLRLMHRGRLSITTKALDEAGLRISRYLLSQAFLNAGFGIAIGLGLFFIGVEYALLWGLIAALSRYIPYVGPWLAAVFPVSMSLAMFDGWGELVAVVVLFTVLDLGVNNLIEPWLYGHSMGVSAVALLVSAALWAFLWGPIGLVLSAPITVVLMVLGRYFPQLRFLEILLGDQPALRPNLSYYQRLLAHDQDGAAELAVTQLKASSPEQVYDNIVLPALSYTRRDSGNGDLGKEEEQYILQATVGIIEEIGDEQGPVQPAATPEQTEAAMPRIRLVGCPADGESDHLALLMLEQLLDAREWDVQILSADLLSAERVAQVGMECPPVIFISSLAPGGLTRARYLCKRMRRAFPEVKIFVGRWEGNPDGTAAAIESLRKAGADLVTTSLADICHQLASWRPIFAALQQEGEDREAPREESPGELTQPVRGKKAAGKFERLQSLVAEKKSP